MTRLDTLLSVMEWAPAAPSNDTGAPTPSDCTLRRRKRDAADRESRATVAALLAALPPRRKVA